MIDPIELDFQYLLPFFDDNSAETPNLGVSDNPVSIVDPMETPI